MEESEKFLEETMQEKAKEYQELIKFAEEQGFNVRGIRTGDYETKYLLFPLGKINDIEYGACLDVDEAEEPDPIINAYVLNILNNELKVSKEDIECYTPEFVIKTAQIEDKNYVIEKEAKKDTHIDKARSLILAFKFKEMGTLDPEFLQTVYVHLTELLPKNITEEIISTKISELEEKVIEVQALDLREKENIIKNIASEFTAYALTALQIEFVPKNLEFPNLAEKGSLYFADTPSVSDALLTWCQQAGYDVEDSAKQQLTNKISELEEEFIAAKNANNQSLQATVITDFKDYMFNLLYSTLKPKEVKFPNLAEVFFRYLIRNSDEIIGDHVPPNALTRFVKVCKRSGNEVKLENLDEKEQELIKGMYYQMLLEEQHWDILALEEITSLLPVFYAEDVAVNLDIDLQSARSLIEDFHKTEAQKFQNLKKGKKEEDDEDDEQEEQYEYRNYAEEEHDEDQIDPEYDYAPEEDE